MIIDKTKTFNNFKQISRIDYKSIQQNFSFHVNNKKQNLLDQHSIELSDIEVSKAKPFYILIFEEAQDKVNNLEKLNHQLNKTQNQKLKNTFSNDSDLDLEMQQNVMEIRKTIKELEASTLRLKLLAKNEENVQTQQLILNLNKQLTLKIQELGSSYRKGQKKYMGLVCQFSNESINSFMGTDRQQQSSLEQESQQQQSQFADNSQEISQIVQSLSELNQIFQQFSEMVVHQGTLLDRIDYNIDETKNQVEKGNVQLQKANNYQKNSCGRNVICVQLILIAIFTTILCQKYNLIKIF